MSLAMRGGAGCLSSTNLWVAALFSPRDARIGCLFLAVECAGSSVCCLGCLQDQERLEIGDVVLE